jgi:hypothetical protein
VSQKKVAKPVWWKNTYFWLAAILFLVGVFGLIAGQESIRDPGQRREGGLVWFYFVAALFMLVNGYISHAQTVRAYEEAEEGANE